MSKTNLGTLRDELFDVLQRLKEGNDPNADPKDAIDLDRAKVMSDVAGRIIDTAKVEITGMQLLAKLNDANAEKAITQSNLLSND